MTNGTNWIQTEVLIRILDRRISEAETEEAAQILRAIRQEIIDELDDLPWEWRRS